MTILVLGPPQQSSEQVAKTKTILEICASKNNTEQCLTQQQDFASNVEPVSLAKT